MKSVQFTKAESLNECDWFTSCGAIDAMVIFDTPFRGQHELTLLGAEQTTSLLVVMIVRWNYSHSTGALFRAVFLGVLGFSEFRPMPICPACPHRPQNL